jgi:hypothetical protein
MEALEHLHLWLLAVQTVQSVAALLSLPKVLYVLLLSATMLEVARSNIQELLASEPANSHFLENPLPSFSTAWTWR